MIKRWNDWGASRPDVAPEEAYKTEWERARPTMEKRKQRYGDSLRNVPLQFGKQYGNAFSGDFRYRDDALRGSGSLRVLYGPTGEPICEFLVNQKSHEDDILVCGLLNSEPQEIDLLGTPLHVVERIDNVFVARRKYLTSPDSEGEMITRLLGGAGVVPVKVAVADRKISVDGDELNLDFTIGECVQCNRPYWQFSDFRDPENKSSGRRASNHPECTDGFGYGWAVGMSDDHFGGYFELTTPFGGLLCGYDCKEIWLNSWDVKLKAEDQVKKFIVELVGDKNYDIGEASLHRPENLNIPVPSHAWNVGLFDEVNGQPVHRRSIIVTVDGTVVYDEPVQN